MTDLNSIRVEPEATAPDEFDVVVDVLDGILPGLVDALADPHLRIILSSLAIRSAYPDRDAQATARVTEWLRDLGVGQLRLTPPEAESLRDQLDIAAGDGPDRCGIPLLSTGEPCDGYATCCTRHGDAVLDRDGGAA